MNDPLHPTVADAKPCCESVYIESITGDLDDLGGVPMKTSDIFRAAKLQLWDGEGSYVVGIKERYVCNTIRFHSKLSNKEKQKAINIVTKLLAPHDTLENWLLVVHGIACNDRLKYQQTRRAWLNHLIKHYEKLGD